MKDGIILEPVTGDEYNQVYAIASNLLGNVNGNVLDIKCFHDYSQGVDHKYAVYCLEYEDKQYVLKQTKQEELEIYMQYLHDSTFKVPKLYSSTQLGEDYWILTEFILGSNGKHFTKEIAIRLAKNLTEILNAHWIENGVAETIETKRFNRYWDRINNRKKCLSNYPELAEAYEIFLKRQKTSPLSLCNGDLMQVNIICNEKDVYIIDWAFGGFMPYALEVARVIAHGTDEGNPFYMTDELRKLFTKSVYDGLTNTQLSFDEFCYDIKLACLNEHIEFLEYNFNNPDKPRDTYFELDLHRSTRLSKEILNTNFNK